MAGRLLRGVLQLGKQVQSFRLGKPMEQSFRLGKPMEQRLRTLSSTSFGPIEDDFIKPGFKFGYPPFGPHYGVNVPTGEDGLPLYVDWTLVPGAVWSAQDQGDNSGLCYIFSSLGAIGSVNFIKTGKSVVLSAQQVLDCNTLTGCGGLGGDPPIVMDFAITAGGLLPASVYPFTGVQDTCKEYKGAGVTIDAWKFIKPNDEFALKYAVAHQPVVVSIRVDKGVLYQKKIIDFDHYVEGIISGPSYQKLDHSVLLVGYDETVLGELFWRLLNSSGLGWGRNGLFEIERGTGQRGGALGILREPLVPLKYSDRNGIVISKCESCDKCF